MSPSSSNSPYLKRHLILRVLPKKLQWLTRQGRTLQDDAGASLVELALVTPLLLLLLVGAFAMGHAFYVSTEVTSAASAGATYGVTNPTDTAGMKKAAVLDGANLGSLAVTAVYGCECSDGTSASASCSTVPTCTYNVVRYVQVNTSLSYTSPLGFPGIPSPLMLNGVSRMRAAY